MFEIIEAILKLSKTCKGSQKKKDIIFYIDVYSFLEI